jgi:hypothetical protein
MMGAYIYSAYAYLMRQTSFYMSNFPLHQSW